MFRYRTLLRKKLYFSKYLKNILNKSMRFNRKRFLTLKNYNLNNNVSNYLQIRNSSNSLLFKKYLNINVSNYVQIVKSSNNLLLKKNSFSNYVQNYLQKRNRNHLLFKNYNRRENDSLF